MIIIIFIIEILFKEREDTPFEEDVLKNPFFLFSWLRYLKSKENSSPVRRFWIYERALKELPGSYKLWYNYLQERVSALEGLPIIHPYYNQAKSVFERALCFMHKMPRIWELYLEFLIECRLITYTRKTFDKALGSLPITQHDHIWPIYIEFAKKPYIPAQTTSSIYKRYLKYEPNDSEDYIDFLLEVNQPGEAVKILSELIHNDDFVSRYGQSKNDMWMRLCELASKYPDQVTLRVEPILRTSLKNFTNEVGKLWVALADYHARLGHFEKAHDVFEEAISSVMTVRDFGIIWDAYIEFEYNIIASQLQKIQKLSETKSKKSKHSDSTLLVQTEKDLFALRLARYEDLISRQPMLISDVVLRQNPNNTLEWNRRISLFENDPKRQVLEFTSALATIDPSKASGKLHSIWIRFAKFWEDNGQLTGARKVFDKAVQVHFKQVEHLANVWTAYIEMELRAADESEGDCKEFQEKARSVIQQATSLPSNYRMIDKMIKLNKKRTGEKILDSISVQQRLFKETKLWALYADLEESYGTFESTKAVYEKIFQLRVATPLIVLNYAHFLEENSYFEDSYRVFEIGVDIFKFPHALDLWVTYLDKFVKHYKDSKIERTRDLFEQAVEKAPSNNCLVLYLMYASFEEKYGMARQTMYIYDRAARSVIDEQKVGVFNIYIRKAAQLFGMTRTREVFERAIELVPDNQVRDFCLRYAKLEKKLGEFDRARAIFSHSSQFCDPRADTIFWQTWKEFEEYHGNTDTFKEMLRIRRSVLAQYNTTINIAASSKILEQAKILAQKDPMKNLEVQAELEDEEDDEAHKTQEKKTSDLSFKNEDEIILEDDEIEDQVTTKSVPDAVFGSLKKKESDKKSEKEEEIVETGARDRLRKKKN